jgi:CBS domain-containing protein
MRVVDLCSAEAVSVEPTASLREAAFLMRNAHVGALVVVEKPGGARRPLGILTDRDIVVAVIAVPGARPEGIRVCDAMSAPPILARADEDPWEVINRMREHGVRRLPVVDGEGALAGIVSAQDLLELFSGGLSGLAEALRLARRRERRERKSIELP